MTGSVPAGSPLTLGPDSVAGVLSARRRTVAVGALSAAAFCIATGENLPVGLLPAMSASLHSSLSATGLLVTVYALVVVVASAPLTYLTRHVPRRLLLIGLLGLFVAGTLAAAAAPGYGWLMAARVVTALCHAVFWSIVTVAAAGLLPAAQRGRAVAGVAAGATLSLVFGVPAGTWIGQHAGWRTAFVALACAGLIVAVAVAALVPSRRPAEDHAAAGSAPDALGYALVLTAILLAVAGAFTYYTYVSAFLTKVSGLHAGAIPPVLLLGGVASLAGVGCAGLLSSRHPGVALFAPPVILAAALLGQYALGTVAPAAAILQACESFGLSFITVSLAARVLVVAPRSTEIASAVYSTAYNVGVAAGPVIGGFVVSGQGLRGTALAGGLLASLALAVVLGEPLAGPAVRRMRHGSAPSGP